MKKISLIIPCYNSSKTLNRCLDSVLAQTYENLEIICINDGSKDNTLEILKEYQTKCNNLIIIDKPNAGQSAGRNDGMKLATGEYIEFLDSDDNFVCNDVLEQNVRLLEENNVDVVIFNFTHPCFETYLESGIYDLKDEASFKKYYQDFFYSSMPWNKLFRREVITEGYDESMHFAEDELFNLANLKNISKVYVNDKVLLNYYCEPVVDKKHASAINSIYVADNFWENKNTIWYKGMANSEKKNAVFEKFFSKGEFDELKFVRPFDFFFHDFGFMCHLNTDIENIKKNCVDGIVRTEDFRAVLKSKEAYGLELKSENLDDLCECMNRFCELGSMAFKLIRGNNMPLKLYRVFFGLFGTCFYNLNENLDTNDVLCETMQMLSRSSTDEARFVNRLTYFCGLTGFKIKQTA